jgi:hypothetical protein
LACVAVSQDGASDRVKDSFPCDGHCAIFLHDHHSTHSVKKGKAMQKMKRMFTSMLVAAFTIVSFVQPVQAAMIGTDQVLAAETVQQNHAAIAAALERPDVVAQLERLGVSKSDAQARVAALTDTEAATLAGQIDSLPAGGDSIIGALVFVFLVLLVTDIIGLTKVFPFTRSR